MARREMFDHFPWEYHLYIDLLPNGRFSTTRRDDRGNLGACQGLNLNQTQSNKLLLMKTREKLRHSEAQKRTMNLQHVCVLFRDLLSLYRNRISSLFFH